MITAILISIFTVPLQSNLPDTLTLKYCHERIKNHYPLAQKNDLQDEITDLNIKIAGTAAYPQLNFEAQATYQSEVTEIPISANAPFVAPGLSKDQYKATLDISQSIYDGGAVGIQKELERIQGEQQKESTQIELHQIKEQVNQVFFGILLAQEQKKVISRLTKNLKAQIKEISSKVDHGAVLPSQKYILEAELFKTHQDSVDIISNIQSGFEVLSQLIGEKVTPETELKVPEAEAVFSDSLLRHRPEFDLFDSNRRALGYQKELARTNKIPSVSAFGTAAYGRPGLNVFDDDLHGYYIVGLRLQWNFWGARNSGTQQQVYDRQQKIISEEERAFERQLKSSLSKIREQIESLEDQLQRDREIVKLREKVVAEKSSQMENGSATATEYITELIKTTQAKLTMEMHQIKLNQTKVEYQTAAGLTEK